AVGAKAEAVLAERDVAGIIAVEIFPQHLVGARADAVAQRFTDADAFSRNPESHGMPRLDGLGQPRLNRFEKGATRATSISSRQEKRTLLVTAALHRGGDAHGFAVFRDRAAGDINAGVAQTFHDRIVGK